MRFAAIIRVSDPRQAAKDKTSLGDQRRLIRKALSDLDPQLKCGTEPVEWYEDQESAYKGKVGGDKPRERFEQMLVDAPTGKFDAVIVAHRSRWSRSPGDNERAVKIFNRCKPRIKFYFLTERLNIHRATGRTTVGIMAQMSEGEVAQFREQVMEGKYTRVTRGEWPYGAKLFGRHRDKFIVDNKVTVGPWEKDKEEIAKADKFYELVVDKGISGRKAAKLLKYGSLTAWRNRIPRLGDTVSLHPEEIETGEKKPIPVKVPRVWPDWKIKQTLDTLAKRSKPRGVRRKNSREDKRDSAKAYRSPLSGKVRCPCGTVMWSGFRNGNRRYIHPGDEWNGAGCIRSIIGPPFEKKAYIKLGKFFTDRKLAEKAFLEGVDKSKERELKTRRADLEHRQRALKERRDKFFTLVTSGSLPSGDTLDAARAEVANLDAESTEVKSGLAQVVQQELDNQMKGDVKKRASGTMQYLFNKYGTQIEGWNEENQKIIVDIIWETSGSLAPVGPKGHSKEAEKWGIYIKLNSQGEPEPDIHGAVDEEKLREMARRLTPGLVRPRLYPDKERKKKAKVMRRGIPTRSCIERGFRPSR